MSARYDIENNSSAPFSLLGSGWDGDGQGNCKHRHDIPLNDPVWFSGRGMQIVSGRLLAGRSRFQDVRDGVIPVWVLSWSTDIMIAICDV